MFWLLVACLFRNEISVTFLAFIYRATRGQGFPLVAKLVFSSDDVPQWFATADGQIEMVRHGRAPSTPLLVEVPLDGCFVFVF